MNSANNDKSEKISSEQTPVSEPSRKELWKPVALILIVFALLILSRVFHLGEKLGQLRGWIESLGVWGPVVFIGIYIAATIAAIPGSALTLAAGAAFGSVQGVIFVSIASTVGASCAFLIARYFARNSVEGYLLKSPKFQDLDRLTQKKGAVIVAVTRLIPLFPFNLLNYGFGLTKVPFWTYLFWSWLCMLPGTILYVAGSDVLFKIFSTGEISYQTAGILAIGIIFLTLAARKAKSYLNEREEEKYGRKN